MSDNLQRAFPKVAGGPPPPPPPPPLPMVPLMPPAPPPPPPPGAPSADGSKPKASGKKTRIEDSVFEPRRFQSVKDRSMAGFVGLNNLGATCYMNSLLQSLFMVPEFRQKIYQWKYNAATDGPTVECIPLQLQKLFLLLAVSECEAVDTSDLTRSFGWTSTQAYEQQDIQELCRVLFSALDASILQQQINGDDGGSGEGMEPMSAMFDGVLAHYIKCLSASEEYTSTRAEGFSDIQLQVRGFPTLASSLTAYTAPEILSGPNQYRAPSGTLVDAEKGARFRRLPFILTIQLLRFDMNWMTMARVKLHDFISFPLTLVMDPYMEDGSAGSTYDLLSIVIHSGGAMGGHYYTYCRSVVSGGWYQFNDQIVTAVTNEQLAAIGVEEAIAEEAAKAGLAPGAADIPKGDGSGADKRGAQASAYMLFYRKRDHGNMSVFPEPAIPAVLAKEIESMAEEFRAARAAQKAKQESVKLRFMYKDDSGEVVVSKHLVLRDALPLALNAVPSIPKDTPLECMRFRTFNMHTKKAGNETYEASMLKTLDENKFPTLKLIAVETRLPHEEFEKIGTTEISVQVRRVSDGITRGDVLSADGGGDFFTPPIKVSLNAETTVGDLKGQLATEYQVPVEHVRVVTLDARTGQARVIRNPDTEMCLSEVNIREGDYLYLEVCTDHASLESIVVDRFRYEQNLIEINFNLPTDSETVEYDQTTTFDKRRTLRELKAQAIGPHIGLNVWEFKLCRNLLAVEYKDEDETLESAQIIDGMAVHVAKGRPMAKDEVNIKVFLFDPTFVFLTNPASSLAGDETPPSESASAQGSATAGDASGGGGVAAPPPPPPLPSGSASGSAGGGGASGSGKEAGMEDKAAMKMFSRQLFEVVIKETDSVETLRSAILHEVRGRVERRDAVAAACHLESVLAQLNGGAHMCVREKAGARALGVLLDSKTVKENVKFLKDRHEICIQIMDTPLKTSADEILLYAHRWLPTSWTLDPRYMQFSVQSNGRVGETRQLLAAMAGIDLEHAQVAKPLRTASLAGLRTDVLDLGWTLDDEHLNGQSPWYLRDGDLLLVRDAREPANVPDDVRSMRPVERGVTITTYQERQARAEEAERAEAQSAVAQVAQLEAAGQSGDLTKDDESIARALAGES